MPPSPFPAATRPAGGGGHLVVDFDGKAVGSDHRPSAKRCCTQLYAATPRSAACCIPFAECKTVASRLFAGAGRDPPGRLRAAEGLPRQQHARNGHRRAGVRQHPGHARGRRSTLLDSQPLWGYLIDGHGLYAWGPHDGRSTPPPGGVRVPVRRRTGAAQARLPALITGGYRTVPMLQQGAGRGLLP